MRADPRSCELSRLPPSRSRWRFVSTQFARGGELNGRSALVVVVQGPIGLLTLLGAKAAGAAHLAVVDLAAAPLAMAANWARAKRSTFPLTLKH